MWCSEHADSRHLHRHSLAASTPSSSNPAEIYAELRAAALERPDRHNAKIVAVKALYATLTNEWVVAGTMTNDGRDEVIALLDTGDLRLWRPMLYVIPRHLINPSRLKKVDPAKRASAALEFVIADLAGHEFDALEFA